MRSLACVWVGWSLTVGISSNGVEHTVARKDSQALIQVKLGHWYDTPVEVDVGTRPSGRGPWAEAITLRVEIKIVIGGKGHGGSERTPLEHPVMFTVTTFGDATYGDVKAKIINTIREMSTHDKMKIVAPDHAVVDTEVMRNVVNWDFDVDMCESWDWFVARTETLSPGNVVEIETELAKELAEAFPLISDPDKIPVSYWGDGPADPKLRLYGNLYPTLYNAHEQKAPNNKRMEEHTKLVALAAAAGQRLEKLRLEVAAASWPSGQRPPNSPSSLNGFDSDSEDDQGDDERSGVTNGDDLESRVREFFFPASQANTWMTELPGGDSIGDGNPSAARKLSSGAAKPGATWDPNGFEVHRGTKRGSSNGIEGFTDADLVADHNSFPPEFGGFDEPGQFMSHSSIPRSGTRNERPAKGSGGMLDMLNSFALPAGRPESGKADPPVRSPQDHPDVSAHHPYNGNGIDINQDQREAPPGVFGTESEIAKEIAEDKRRQAMIHSVEFGNSEAAGVTRKPLPTKNSDRLRVRSPVDREAGPATGKLPGIGQRTVGGAGTWGL